MIGTECSCEEHVKIFKKKGIWIEDGTVRPKPGYIIVYNWDKASQPNDGFSDHIGVVETVSGNQITIIEGNRNQAVSRRSIPVGWGYIRGYASPRYASASKEETNKKEYNVDAVAKDVIAGKYGCGDDRRKALEAAGYSYITVQTRVNELVKAASAKKTVDTIAREVIQGKWGNGSERKRRLTKAGYDYSAIQKRVNELL